MTTRSHLERANDNAAAHWLGMAAAEGWESRVRPGYTAVRCDRAVTDAHRVLLTRRPPDAAALTAELLDLFRGWDTRRLCLEDPYGALDLTGYGCEAALRMPVMVREAGPQAGPQTGPQAVAGAGRVAGAPGRASEAVPEVLEAVLEAELAAVEQAVVEGFPIAAQWPWHRGRMFPPSWSALPGRRSWLARRSGATAAACVSWDDGTSVGLYWVATLPEHRSHGVARALLEAVLRAHPERPAALTATLLGEPLYRKLGFVEQGLSTWWRYPGQGPAVADSGVG